MKKLLQGIVLLGIGTNLYASPLTKETPHGITIVSTSKNALHTEVLLSAKHESCRMHIDNMQSIKKTDCTQFTNSKHMKIVCTPRKKICKTEKELFAYIAQNATGGLKKENVSKRAKSTHNTLLKEGSYSWHKTNSEASLRIRKKNHTFSIKGDALSGTTNKYGPNMGELAFTAPMKNRTIVYRKGAYTFTLKVNADGSLKVTEKGYGADFGRGVSFEGHFTLDRHTK